MKKLLLIALAAMTFTVSRADNLVIPVTANVVSNLFANGKTIDSITVTATTTNITTFKFYDSSNTSRGSLVVPIFGKSKRSICILDGSTWQSELR